MGSSCSTSLPVESQPSELGGEDAREKRKERRERLQEHRKKVYREALFEQRRDAFWNEPEIQTVVRFCDDLDVSVVMFTEDYSIGFVNSCMLESSGHSEETIQCGNHLSKLINPSGSGTFDELCYTEYAEALIRTAAGPIPVTVYTVPLDFEHNVLSHSKKASMKKLKRTQSGATIPCSPKTVGSIGSPMAQKGIRSPGQPRLLRPGKESPKSPKSVDDHQSITDMPLVFVMFVMPREPETNGAPTAGARCDEPWGAKSSISSFPFSLRLGPVNRAALSGGDGSQRHDNEESDASTTNSKGAAANDENQQPQLPSVPAPQLFVPGDIDSLADSVSSLDLNNPQRHRSSSDNATPQSSGLRRQTTPVAASGGNQPQGDCGISLNKPSPKARASVFNLSSSVSSANGAQHFLSSPPSCPISPLTDPHYTRGGKRVASRFSLNSSLSAGLTSSSPRHSLSEPHRPSLASTKLDLVAIAAAFGDITMAIDPFSKKMVYGSPAALHLFNTDEASFVDKPYIDFLHPCEHGTQHTSDTLTRLAEAGNYAPPDQKLQLIADQQTKDTVLASVASVLVMSRTNVVVRLCEKRNKAGVRFSRSGGVPEELVHIVDSLADATILVTLTGQIAHCNATFPVLVEGDEDQIIGKNVSAFVPVYYRENHDEYLKRLIPPNTRPQRRMLKRHRAVVATTLTGDIVPVDITISEVNFSLDKTYYMTTMRRLLTDEILSRYHAIVNSYLIPLGRQLTAHGTTRARPPRGKAKDANNITASASNSTIDADVVGSNPTSPSVDALSPASHPVLPVAPHQQTASSQPRFSTSTRTDTSDALTASEVELCRLQTNSTL
ncbi:hypothetical protein DIPPA_23616 [Diplonema papillatum]|nr:hypothetical protein DIPPA_23616 [Diplonema papillatum]